MATPILSKENISEIENAFNLDKTVANETHKVYLIAMAVFVDKYIKEGNDLERLNIAKELLECLVDNFYICEEGTELENQEKVNKLHDLLGLFFPRKSPENTSLETYKGRYDLANKIIDIGAECGLISNPNQAKIIHNIVISRAYNNPFCSVFVSGIDNAKKNGAKKGARIVNAQHKDRQDFVFKWLDANYKDGDTHEDLASRLEPLLDGERKYGTILKDISTWKKERGAARKR